MPPRRGTFGPMADTLLLQKYLQIPSSIFWHIWIAKEDVQTRRTEARSLKRRWELKTEVLLDYIALSLQSRPTDGLVLRAAACWVLLQLCVDILNVVFRWRAPDLCSEDFEYPSFCFFFTFIWNPKSMRRSVFIPYQLN